MRILVKYRVALAGQILGLTPQHFLFFFSFPLWKLIGLRPGKQLESRGTRRERFIDAWRAHIISSYFGVSKSPLVFESILIIKRKYCLLKKLHLHFKVKLKKNKEYLSLWSLDPLYSHAFLPLLLVLPSSLHSPSSFSLHISFFLFLQKISFSAHNTMTIRNKRIRQQMIRKLIILFILSFSILKQ